MNDWTRTVLVTLFIVVAVFVLLPLLWGGMMMGGAMGPWMMGGWNGSWGWGGAVGLIFMVLFWVLLIGGVVLLVRWGAGSTTSGQSRTPGEISAVKILKRRYASGEITKAEYEQMQKDLS